MENTLKTDSTPRIPLYLLGTCALVVILFVAKEIIIPLVFATLFSIVLSSIVKRLVNKGVTRVLAVAITVIPALLIVLSLTILFISQLTSFADTFPKLLDKFRDLSSQFIYWIAEAFNIPPKGIKSWLTDMESNMLDKSGAVIGYTLTTMSSALVALFIVPVYIFMLLYYQPILVGFIRQVFGRDNHDKVNEILPVTKEIIKSYLIGLIIEAAIVAALNSIGLLILGIEYAILLGVLGAILNVIPYLGGIIAVVLYMIVALVTKSPSVSLLVLVNYLIIQFIDNNFLVPKVIGSKVKLNALVSIVAVIAGGALWGIPGMFLSIPLIALVKVICDRIEPLQPWGFLLGDSMPENYHRIKYFKGSKKPIVSK